jgi:predicted esterase
MSLVLVSPFLLSGASPDEKIIKESISSEGKKRTYYLFVPSIASPSSPAPLVVALHGSGRNGLSLVEKWKDLATREGVIVVGPDAQDSSQWSVPQDGPVFLRDLIEHLKANHPINPRRVYLFGHSAGAVFSLYMSLIESEYFAATAIHAGAFNAQGAKPIELAKRKIPLAIWVGANDQFFPLTTVRATRDALRAADFPVQLTEIPGHDHNYYGRAPEINRQAWEFLRKHELSEDPRYEPYRFGK